MSITHVGRSKWRKGIYKPINPSKYKGKDLPVFRSQWEFRMMRYFDLSQNILEWKSEEPLIPYLNPNTGTVWNYHPDFLILVKTQLGVRTQMIEIKPKKQTIPPSVTPGKHRNTLLKEAQSWAMNQAKWRNAKAYCDQRGWDFKIMTEDDIFA